MRGELERGAAGWVADEFPPFGAYGLAKPRNPLHLSDTIAACFCWWLAA